MNIFDDFTHGNKYSFKIGDVVGNLLYIYKKEGIEDNKVTFDLARKYMWYLLDKFTKERIKVEFIFSEEDIDSFVSFYKDEFKKSTGGIELIKDIPINQLRARYHCMPLRIVEIFTDDEIVGKVLEDYKEEKNPKILDKKD